MKQLDLFEDKPSMFENSSSLFDAIAKNLSGQIRQVFEPPLKEWDIICGCRAKHHLTYKPVITRPLEYSRIADPGEYIILGNYIEEFICTNCGLRTRVVNTKIKEIKSDLREARNNG